MAHRVTEHALRAPTGPGVPPPAQPFVPTPQQITIGQMYVQFQIPAKKNGTGWPVIMVHGSSHTAACLESTPDGREGWYPYFVRKGISTYVVDWCSQIPGTEQEHATALALETRMPGQGSAGVALCRP